MNAKWNKIRSYLLFALLSFVTVGHMQAQSSCDFQIEINPDVNIDFGDSVELYLYYTEVMSRIASISWENNGSVLCNQDICSNLIVSPLESTCYSVSVINDAGCEVRATTCITVAPNEIILYPNPTKEFLTIESNFYPLLEIWIYNSLGQIIYASNRFDENTNHDNIKTIDVSSFAVGMYYVDILHGNIRTTEPFWKF